jgi:hypothetical protein
MVSSSLDLNVLNNVSRRMSGLAVDDSSRTSRKDFLASLASRIRSFGVGRRDPLIAQARTTLALRELASHYESTQPSYAADLLAAAEGRVEEEEVIW